MTQIPRSPSAWRRYLRFWRANPRADVDDELTFHLAMRVRDLEAQGLSPQAARAQADREFGDLPAIREACVTIDERQSRRANRNELVGDLWSDLHAQLFKVEAGRITHVEELVRRVPYGRESGWGSPTVPA